VLIAFGSCAHQGGIPGLANNFDRESILARVYDTAPSNAESTRGVRPAVSTQMPEGELTLPAFHFSVKTLAQTVPVEYFMPGCPPVVDQIRIVLHALLAGELPPAGSVIGADPKTNCDVCTREKSPHGVRIKVFRRPHEIEIDPDICFLEQGLLCCGPATRAGCGLPCIQGNMPCRGCYGPPEGVEDQGAKLLSAIAAIIDADTAEELQAVMDTIVDPLGTYFRFGLSDSILSELKFG
jgi:F420-non-reducing hydrogenase small subunit